MVIQDEVLAKFLRECLGVSLESLKNSYENDSDWSLVIKLHAYIEAALNFLIVKHLGDARLEDVIARLDISDRNRGKMAFVKALELLPKQHRSFIQKFSELRNKLVHDVKNVDFDLKAYIEGLDSAQFKELSGAIVPIITSLVIFIGKPTEEQALSSLKGDPRNTILICTIAIMLIIYDKEQLRELLS